MAQELSKLTNNKDERKRHLRSRSRGRSAIPTYIFDFDLASSRDMLSQYSHPIEIRKRTALEIEQDKERAKKVMVIQSDHSQDQNSSSIDSKEEVNEKLKKARDRKAHKKLHTRQKKTSFEMFTYSGISTGRRHTPDPLTSSAAAFEPFHRHMSRVEKRTRFQERERSNIEHHKFEEMKEGLEGPLWRTILPTITKIDNPRDKKEMEKKCKQSLDEIQYYLDRYERYKKMEKRILGRTSLLSYTEGESVGNASSHNTNGTNNYDESYEAAHGNKTLQKYNQSIGSTTGVSHNTYDDWEPGVDYISPKDNPYDDEEDFEQEGKYQYEWIYDK